MNSIVKEKFKARGIYLLPNFFTLSAMFAGFYAIIANISGMFEQAAMAIFIAMLLDSLDGRVARLTNTQTAFGAEFDSLSDAVSFGVAPALLVYHWQLFRLGKLGWLLAFLYVAAVVLRLARFNTQLAKVGKRYFQGLPCPAPAGVIAGLVWVASDFSFNGWLICALAAMLTLFLAVCMVSNVRYRSFKDFDLRNNVSFLTMLLVVLILFFLSLDPSKILFALFAVYAFSGPIMTLWERHKKLKVRRIRRKRKNTASDIDG
ncbi:MAG: CDP-diacylglycerol--serine O-phosphatidyltransferase [Gammaproteobacteria bacterium]|nr:CDP-diacylglycerol--serine O-phosphatidyltransferase [Gammaproteobacteria bacterium]